MENKEVKNDIADDDLKAFEEAQDKDEIKTGVEREIDEKEEKEEEESKESEEENLDEDLDEKSTEDASTTSKVEIKDVDGETPRERGLRLELTRLKREKRARDEKEMFKEEKSTKKSDYNYDELEDKFGYTKDQIDGLDEMFDVIGEKKGFIRKEQSNKTMAQETLVDFIEEHPEYAPENDKDDIYWGRFNNILKSDYNIKGKSSRELKKTFLKIDRDVKEELGDTTKKTEAQKQKIESVSNGASTSSKIEKTVKPKISGNHPNINFKGFDEGEEEEFIN